MCLLLLLWCVKSTGNAKAIQLTHANFLNISLNGFQANLPMPQGASASSLSSSAKTHVPIFEANDRVLATASCAFDAHIQESVGVLCAGATCVLLRPGGHLDAGYLLEEVVQKKQISMLSCVPSLLQALLQHVDDMSEAQPRLVEALGSLRLISVGGEAVKPALVAKVLDATTRSKSNAYNAQPAHFVNLYGFVS
jgi:non-ribosomal peptide synthetase component F